MTIPDFQTVMRPILHLLSDGEVWPTRSVIDAMAEQFGLSEAERAELIPSGRQRRIDNKVHWSLTHLSQAGLLERPLRAHVQITDAGRQVLTQHPDRVDMSVLNTFESYRAFRQRSRDKAKVDDGGTVDVALVVPTSPEDLIEAAVAENRAAVEGEILERALALSPVGFEDLVIRLLEAMGYGRAGSAERTSVTGDAGIDGIISQDPLGLDRIYVQAKRYAVDRSIDRPGSMSSPARCWASRVIAASTSRPPPSPEEPGRRRIGSTPASS